MASAPAVLRQGLWDLFRVVRHRAAGSADGDPAV